MRVAVSTVTCRVCARVVAQSIPRVADADEIDQPSTGCSPAFAQAECPYHPAAPPRRGPLYAKDELPLLWSTFVLDLPAAATPEARLVALSRNLDFGPLVAGAGWPEILRTAAATLADPTLMGAGS